MERLCDLRGRRFVVECPPCKRRGTYDLARLRQRFGEHADLYDVYLRLTQTCRDRPRGRWWADQLAVPDVTGTPTNARLASSDRRDAVLLACCTGLEIPRAGWAGNACERARTRRDKPTHHDRMQRECQTGIKPLHDAFTSIDASSPSTSPRVHEFKLQRSRAMTPVIMPDDHRKNRLSGFIAGLSTLVSIMAVNSAPARYPHRSEADALFGDGVRIGDDMRKVIAREHVREKAAAK